MKSIIITFLGFLLLVDVTEAQKPWIEFYTNTIELNGSTQKDIQVIPLKLEPGIAFKDVNILYGQPLFIRLDNKYEKSYLDGFKISKASDSVPSVEIVADLEILKAAGNYDGAVVFTAKDKREEVSFSIIRPAARLENLHPVIIKIEGNKIVNADVISLRETGKSSGVRQLQLSAPAFFGADQKISPISFPEKIYTIKPGTITQITYVPNNTEIANLPLGEHIGKLEINSAEMNAPLSFDIKIIHKRSNWWIILIIFAGTLFGAFVRHFISRKKELEEKRLQALELLQKIKDEMSTIQDKEFNNAVGALTQDLNAALGTKNFFFRNLSDTTSTINTLIQTTTAAYNEKKAAFESNTKIAVDNLKVLSISFENDILTPVVAENLKKAKTFYEQSKENVTRRDISSASNNIDAVKKIVRKFIQDYSTAINHLATYVENDKILPSIITEPQKTIIKEKNTDIRRALEKINVSQDNIAYLTTAIYETDSVQSNVDQMLNTLKDSVANLYQPIYKPGTPEMEELRTSFENWQSTLQKVINDPFQNTDLITGTDNLNKSLNKIKSSMPAPATRLANEDEENIAEGPAKLLWLRRKKSDTGVNFVDINFKTGSIQSAINRAERNWFIYSVIQTVFIFLLLALAAYKFYAPTFIGTIDEIIALFLVAFTMDITVDNVIQLRDKTR